MSSSFHYIFNSDAADGLFNNQPSCSIDLVVTSPPYPMVQMWDDLFGYNPKTTEISPLDVFEYMHNNLNKIWRECARVVIPGGFICINIGDATRNVNNQFQLFPNHVKISDYFRNTENFSQLPSVIWRKASNSPSKFMGSGMLPCGAYITMEHEYILVFRKPGKRNWKEKNTRYESALFFEERNQYFSDLWEIPGTKQSNTEISSSRERTAAYPIEIPKRLIQMYSCEGDTILDPFAGTGTTMKAALMLGRNSFSYEIDSALCKNIIDTIPSQNEFNNIIQKRFDNHKKYLREREASGKIAFSNFNEKLKTIVASAQETKIHPLFVKTIIKKKQEMTIEVEYSEERCFENALF